MKKISSGESQPQIHPWHQICSSLSVLSRVVTYKCLKSTILHEILSFSLRLLRTLLTLKYIHEFSAMIKCLELKTSESDVDERRFLNTLEIVIASSSCISFLWSSIENYYFSVLKLLCFYEFLCVGREWGWYNCEWIWGIGYEATRSNIPEQITTVKLVFCHQGPVARYTLGFTLPTRGIP